MKTLRDILKFVPVLLALAAFAACTEQFDDPERYKEWTEEEIVAEGYEMKTIWDFKYDFYYKEFGTSAGNAVNSVVIDSKVAIKGKVISTDQPGNLYRSLYIQDETGAIELKIGKTNLYNDYKVGQEIYVLTDGLYLGMYRFMLSLGGRSTDVDYSNGFINSNPEIDRVIKRGRMVGLNAADTLVVNAADVATKLRDPQDLGRLVRFEEAECVWGTAPVDGYSSSDLFPSFLAGVSPNFTTFYWHFKQDANGNYFENAEGNIVPVGGKWGQPSAGQTRYTGNWKSTESNLEWARPAEGSSRPDYPTWAFRDTGYNYYGSVLFKLGDKYFVVRSSGYSLFAWVQIPADGEKANVTAMYNKYTSRSGGFTKYQTLINSSNDVADPLTNDPLYYFDRNHNPY